MAEAHDPFDQQGQDAADSLVEEARRLERDREVDDFRWLMGHKQGKRFMWRMLGMTGLYRNPHIPGQEASVLFRCGEQNLGQRLNAEIHDLCPERYNEMVKEQLEWQRKQQKQ